MSTLNLSELMIANPDLKSFGDLVMLVRRHAEREGRHFHADVKPHYPDTPRHWQDILETAFMMGEL